MAFYEFFVPCTTTQKILRFYGTQKMRPDQAKPSLNKAVFFKFPINSRLPFSHLCGYLSFPQSTPSILINFIIFLPLLLQLIRCVLFQDIFQSKGSVSTSADQTLEASVTCSAYLSPLISLSSDHLFRACMYVSGEVVRNLILRT